MTAVRLFPEQPNNSPVTVASLVRQCLADLEGRVLLGTFSTDHLENVRHYLNQFAKFLGTGRLVVDCRQYDLTAWLAANPSWKSICTKRNAIGAVLSCFRWAEDEELIDRCPYRRPRALRGVADKPRRPAEETEYQQLLRGGSWPLRHALFFLWHTGARTCEMREVLWAEVHLDAAFPHISLDKHKTLAKTGKPRLIALDDTVARFLRGLDRDTGWVFTNCDGGQWDRHTFARHLRRTAERIGLDDGVIERVSGYCLRHSYTCGALESGFTSKEVADLLGHSDTKMVERVYGSHTSQHIDYLARTAEGVRKRRGKS